MIPQGAIQPTRFLAEQFHPVNFSVKYRKLDPISLVGLLSFVCNMVLLIQSLLFLSISVSSAAAAAAPCNRFCGTNPVPYPFGFSPGCKIPLNCSIGTNGDPRIRIGEFEVKNFTSHSLVLRVPPSCNRSILEANALFSNNYAISSSSTLLVTNCRGNASFGCEIPVPRCVPSNESLRCYFNDAKDSFFSRDIIIGGGCSFLYSVTSFNGDNTSQPSSIDLETLMLEWWLEGGCELCSNNSDCHDRFSPITNKRSVTCSCKDGFVGDGFSAGNGCQRVSSNSECNSSKYLSRKCGGSSRRGALIGGIVAGAALVTGLALLLCSIRRRRNASLRIRNSTKLLLSEVSSNIPLYNYKDIKKAADGFSEKNRLGTGAYGTVYFGKLPNNEAVAVKKLRSPDAESIDQFMNEIKLLSSVSHPNLVRLVGCCIEKGEQVLVYEYMPNGTLSQHLQRDRGRVLPWTIRLNIAAETAKAIAHLHSAIHPPIYHRDIKSSNILLDYNFNSKVADFGLSRMIVTDSSHVSTAPQGTPGYLDPLYHQNFHLSDKSDVYSFGVVLVEILTAKKVVDFSRGQSEVNLAALAIAKIAKGCVDEIIDPYLEPHRDEWTMSSIHKVVELAFRCLAFDRDMRPTMIDVAEELEEIRLSGWTPTDENMQLSKTCSLRSSPSNMTDRSRESRARRMMACVNPMEDVPKGNSPISVQDPWRSEQSSPSANSLLGSVVR